MAYLVYGLCALTALMGTCLLYLAYRRTRYQMLFWSALCFAGLAWNNLLLVVDKLVVPSVDLTFVRACISLIAMLVLLYGLIWDAE